jgi:hypothetical protein
MTSPVESVFETVIDRVLESQAITGMIMVLKSVSDSTVNVLVVPGIMIARPKLTWVFTAPSFSNALPYPGFVKKSVRSKNRK